MDVNTVKFYQFVTENRTDGVVTSLTIKVAAYTRPAETSYTGDGNYLTHDDATWKIKTITGKDYYDYDSSYLGRDIYTNLIYIFFSLFQSLNRNWNLRS